MYKIDIIINKSNDDSISSYFIDELDLRNLLNIINNDSDNNIKIVVEKEQRFGQFQGGLINDVLRYIKIEDFEKYFDSIDKYKIVDIICYEIAFNEEYCDYIYTELDEYMKTSPELGLKIVNIITDKSVSIMKNHMKEMERRFYEFKYPHPNKTLPSNEDVSEDSDIKPKPNET